MKKCIVTRFVSLIMAICMLFAMTVVASAEETGSEETASSIRSNPHFHDTTTVYLSWGTSVFCWQGDVIRDYAYINAVIPANASQMCVKAYYRIYSGDSNQSYLRIKVFSPDSSTNPKLNDGCISNTYYRTSPQSSWISVTGGQTVTLKVDASCFYSGDSTGTYRYADFEKFELYCH